MTTPFDDRSAHVAPEVLAAMADPAGVAPDDDRIAAHLAACRHCMAVYAEFSRAHVGHALAAEAAPDELLERGKAIASDPNLRESRPAAGAARAARALAPGAPEAVALAAKMRLRRARRLAPALAAAVVCALLVAWRGGWLGPRPAVGPDLVAPDVVAAISERLRDDSFDGLAYTGTLVPRARETRGPSAAAPGADLATLVDSLAAHPGSADVAFWLAAGLLAEDGVREALPYVRASQTRFPDDARFHNLAAILAYKRSELQIAEAELRRALAIDREAVYLVNLARVLEEQGRKAEAEPLWEEVLTQHADVPIAAVARARRSF